MANLWKDGDVITADKLNRFVIANLISTEENNQQIISLDIVPADVFDENNMMSSFIVVNDQQIVDTTISSRPLFVYNSSYDTSNGSYTLGVNDLSGNNQLEFIAESRTDYFVANIPPIDPIDTGTTK